MVYKFDFTCGDSLPVLFGIIKSCGVRGKCEGTGSLSVHKSDITDSEICVRCEGSPVDEFLFSVTVSGRLVCVVNVKTLVACLSSMSNMETCCIVLAREFVLWLVVVAMVKIACAVKPQIGVNQTAAALLQPRHVSAN